LTKPFTLCHFSNLLFLKVLHYPLRFQIGDWWWLVGVARGCGLVAGFTKKVLGG
jgi:hypothetical protein